MTEVCQIWGVWCLISRERRGTISNLYTGRGTLLQRPNALRCNCPFPLIEVGAGPLDSLDVWGPGQGHSPSPLLPSPLQSADSLLGP